MAVCHLVKPIMHSFILQLYSEHLGGLPLLVRRRLQYKRAVTPGSFERRHHRRHAREGGGLLARALPCSLVLAACTWLLKSENRTRHAALVCTALEKCLEGGAR